MTKLYCYYYIILLTKHEWGYVIFENETVPSWLAKENLQFRIDLLRFLSLAFFCFGKACS